MSVKKKSSTRDDISFKSLDGLVGYHLKRASGEVIGRFPVQAAMPALKPTEFAVLAVIGDNIGLRAADLCECLNFQQPNLVKVLNRFAQLGWLSRTPDPLDGRAVMLDLTEEGRHLVKSLRQAAQNSESPVLKKLSTDEKKQLVMLLKKIYN